MEATTSPDPSTAAATSAVSVTAATANATATAPLAASSASAPPAAGGSTSNPNAKIVDEFQYLLEKSQQLFAGLRDLPPTGKNWQPYFQRTFEVYTKLWKFQQQHRVVLENKDVYGLKRWEIGEIASKIGQLYYHYYLRTSETNYLYESYVFYEAIRDRQYFRDVMESKNPALMIKKLRYYARFIVVCLLLNRNDIIKKLMEELESLVQQYTKDFKPTDAAEWNVVLTEISTFLEAERKLAPIDVDGVPFSVPSRLQIERTSKLDKDGQAKLRLQEAILVGNYQNQIKFSELTLDMYRLLQSLEREPNTQGGRAVTSEPTEKKEDGVEGAEGDKNASRRTNPHKYLLYRPTFAQLFLYLSTAFKDINENSALLLYISADGSKRQAKPTNPGYAGGIATAVNFTRKANEKSDVDQISLLHSLHPADLVPFTRKPLFVIVDSTNSTAFKDTPREFNQSLVCLMSPTEYPSTVKDSTQIGSIFTLFLHSPVKAFAFVSDLTEIQPDVWGKCVSLVLATEKVIFELLEGSHASSLDKSFKRFLQDDFLRQITIRFIFCSATLQSHIHFKESKHLPSSLPALPQTLLAAPEILAKLQEIAVAANVANMYNFNPTSSTPMEIV
ncbi:protein SCAI [Zopfochytrium polystomum]|nr:protein SCAI [Zopfochytrium polystomum]